MNFYDVFMSCYAKLSKTHSDRALYILMELYKKDISEHMECCLVPVEGVTLVESYNGYFCKGFRQLDIISGENGSKFDMIFWHLVNNSSTKYSEAVKYSIEWQLEVSSGANPKDVYDKIMDELV